MSSFETARETTPDVQATSKGCFNPKGSNAAADASFAVANGTGEFGVLHRNPGLEGSRHGASRNSHAGMPS